MKIQKKSKTKEKQEENNKEEEKKEEAEGEKEDLSPEEDLKNFLNKQPSYENLYRMLKVGVPYIAVSQKAKLNGYDMDLFEELYEKSKKVNAQIQ